MFSSCIHIVRILLVTATLLVVGIHGYYSAREWIAKWAFAHQTEFGIDELILIAIPQTDHSRQTDFLVSQEEFVWQGNMVDVLHREVRSDTLYIYGFRDDAETELKREASWLYRDPNQPDSLPSAGTKRAKWFSPFVLPERVVVSLVVWSVLPNRQNLFTYSPPNIRFPSLEVLLPPPDL